MSASRIRLTNLRLPITGARRNWRRLSSTPDFRTRFCGLRRFPVFGIPGNGRYGVRPIYVEDMARLIVDCVDRQSNSVVDAVGPDSFTFEELVQLIASKVGRSVKLIHMPAAVAYLSTLVTGWFVGDLVLTWEEYKGLMGNLLAQDGPSAGDIRLSDWLAENHDRVGRKYASEIARHF